MLLLSDYHLREGSLVASVQEVVAQRVRLEPGPAVRPLAATHADEVPPTELRHRERRRRIN